MARELPNPKLELVLDWQDVPRTIRKEAVQLGRRRIMILQETATQFVSVETEQAKCYEALSRLGCSGPLIEWLLERAKEETAGRGQFIDIVVEYTEKRLQHLESPAKNLTTLLVSVPLGLAAVAGIVWILSRKPTLVHLLISGYLVILLTLASVFALASFRHVAAYYLDRRERRQAAGELEEEQT